MQIPTSSYLLKPPSGARYVFKDRFLISNSEFEYAGLEAAVSECLIKSISGQCNF